MSQSNSDERDVNREFLGKEYNSKKTDSGKVLLIYLSLNVDIPKHIEFSKKAEHTKICNAIIEGFFDKISKSSFPPGKFETPYDFALDFKDVVVNNYVNVKLSLLWSRGFESNGLVCRYENDVLSINGTPNNPKGCDGIVQFVLDGCFYDVKELRERRGFAVKSFFKDIKIKQKFVLNPDPDSLWEDNPTPENAPFQKPNVAVKSGATVSTPSLTVLGASQRGRSHAQIGSFRDDHFLIRLGENPDDWNFVAVADGAGSALFSREGSKIACEACIDDPKTGLATLFSFFKDSLDQEITSLTSGSSDSSKIDFSEKLPQTNLEKYFYYSVYHAGKAIENASKQANAKLNDFNTTLLCAAFKRLPKTEQTPSRWIVLSYWVGDGGLAIYRPNGKETVFALGTPDGGEFAGQTRFLTMKSELTEAAICARLRLAVVEDFQALVLATDGITDPFFPAEANLSDYAYWQKFWNETLPKEFPGVLEVEKTFEERGQALLDGLKFKSKGNHDDRTLVLVLNDAFKEVPIAEEISDSEEKNAPDNSCGIMDDGGIDELATIDADAIENRLSEESVVDAKKSPDETCVRGDLESSISNEKTETANNDPVSSLEGETVALNEESETENRGIETNSETLVSEESPKELPPPPDEILLAKPEN